MTRTRVLLLCAIAALPAALLARPASPQVYAAYDGRPEFREGSDLSYFVWHDGEKWYIRWTTLAQPRQFEGSVRAAHGKLDGLKRIDPEEDYKVVRPGRAPHVVRGPMGRARGVAPGRPATVAATTADHAEQVADHLIRWSMWTNMDLDGINFKVNKDVDELTFDLKIQGISRAINVEIGAGSVHPAGNPFSVRIR